MKDSILINHRFFYLFVLTTALLVYVNLKRYELTSNAFWPLLRLNNDTRFRPGLLRSNSTDKRHKLSLVVEISPTFVHDQNIFIIFSIMCLEAIWTVFAAFEYVTKHRYVKWGFLWLFKELMFGLWYFRSIRLAIHHILSTLIYNKVLVAGIRRVLYRVGSEQLFVLLRLFSNTLQ